MDSAIAPKNMDALVYPSYANKCEMISAVDALFFIAGTMISTVDALFVSAVDGSTALLCCCYVSPSLWLQPAGCDLEHVFSPLYYVMIFIAFFVQVGKVAIQAYEFKIKLI